MSSTKKIIEIRVVWIYRDIAACVSFANPCESVYVVVSIHWRQSCLNVLVSLLQQVMSRPFVLHLRGF